MATITKKPGIGGNFHGACRGLDQAVRFINSKHLSQDIHAKTWAFILVIHKTPGCVYTFRPKNFKEGKLHGEQANYTSSKW